jgi:hypothetical protein
VGSNVTSYGDAASSGTRYYYRVRAFNSAGSSAYSNVLSVTTPTTTTTTVTITLSATALKVQSIRYALLSWRGATSTLVDVYRNGTKVVTVPNSGSYLISLGSGGSATFSFKVCKSGTTICSNTTSVTF